MTKDDLIDRLSEISADLGRKASGPQKSGCEAASY